MPNIISVGRRLIPSEQIALVESYDPAANPQFKTEKPFKTRVVLINRDSVLTEDTPQMFADANGFRLLVEDNVATNPVHSSSGSRRSRQPRASSRQSPTSRVCSGAIRMATIRADC